MSASAPSTPRTRHGRTHAPTLIGGLNLGLEATDGPSSTSALEDNFTTPRARRAARPPASPCLVASPQLEVWYQGQGSPVGTPQQPTFTFPSTTHNVSSPLTLGSPFAASSPILTKQGNAPLVAPRAIHPSNAPNLGWRDVGEKNETAKRIEQEKALQRKMSKNAIDGKKDKRVIYLKSALGAVAALALVFCLIKAASVFDPSEPGLAHRSRIPSIFQSAKRDTKEDLESFRHELDHELQYLVSPTAGNLAEQTMNIYHLAHLGKVLQRVPLLAPLSVTLARTHHVALPVAQLYDLPRFRAVTNVSALDWSDIRPAHYETIEPLGCWVGPAAAREPGALDAREKLMKQTGVSPTFVTLRASTSRTQHGAKAGDELRKSHEFLKSFAADHSGQDGVMQQAVHANDIVSPIGQKHAKPEEHVFCLDPTLYRPEHLTEAHVEGNGLDPRDHTAFHSHGKALHFTPELIESAADVAGFMLGSHAPYISVHIDAAAHERECTHLGHAKDCSPLLQGYVDAVERIRHLSANSAAHRKSRKERHHVRTLSVLVSTDVADLGFLGELANLGWHPMDYADLELRARFGTFSAEVMDAVIHSRAVGFVGTRGSAESTLAALRVDHWRHGPVELVGVSAPGASHPAPATRV